MKGKAMLQLLKTCYLNGYFVLRLWFKLTHSASAGSRKIAQNAERKKKMKSIFFLIFIFYLEPMKFCVLCPASSIKFNIFDSISYSAHVVCVIHANQVSVDQVKLLSQIKSNQLNNCNWITVKP